MEAVSPGYGTADIARAPRSPELLGAENVSASPIFTHNVGDAGIAVAARRLDFAESESENSAAQAGAGFATSSVITREPPKNTSLSRITDDKTNLYKKMLVEATTNPWDVDAPDVSLLPPYNSPDKRSRLAFFGIQAKSNIIVESLLSLDKRSEGAGAGVASPKMNKMGVRQLYNLGVEIEYTAYLMNLWQMDMSIAYFELIFDEIQRAEQENRINTMADLVSIRDGVLAQVAKNAPMSFFEMDRYRRCLWVGIDDKGNEHYDLAVLPVLKAYSDAFVLWESKSNAGLINVNQRFDIVVESLRDLEKLISNYREVFGELEKVQSDKVQAFYKAVGKSLRSIILINPSLFKVNVSDTAPSEALQSENGRVAELFNINPDDPASVMRFSHIVTHQVPFDAIDRYRNNFLHWAYLCENYHASDWLLRELMQGAITGDHDNPLLGMENMFEQKPKKVAQLYPNMRNLHILYRAAKAAESQLNSDGAMRPFSPVDFASNEEVAIYNKLKLVMERIPFLCKYLIEIERFLTSYEAEVIKAKETEAELHSSGDLLTQLKWRLMALAGYDNGAILQHRKAAILKLQGFKEWLANNTKYLDITNAEQLRGEVIDEIVRQAEQLIKDIDVILHQKGITSGSFNQMLSGARVSIAKVTDGVGTVREKLATQALKSVPRDDAGKPLVHTGIVYASPRDYVDRALVRENEDLH